MLIHVEDGDDVGMAESPGRLRFPREPLARIRGVELLAHQLDRHETADLRVFRQIERTHAAKAKAGYDFVPTNGRGIGRCHAGFLILKALLAVSGLIEPDF